LKSAVDELSKKISGGADVTSVISDTTMKSVEE